MSRVQVKSQKKTLDPNGKLNAKQRHKLNHVRLGGPGISWQVRSLPQKKQFVKAVSVKEGNWLGMSDDLTRPFEIPYIDRFGKFTGCTMYTSGMTQQSYISTVISTISRRLLFWGRSHNNMKKVSHNLLEKLVVKASAVYAMTKNTYMLDRVLALLKNVQRNRKAITGVIASFASKLDAYKGFIYSQACSHAHWLTSRAKRPREKSRPELHAYPLREVGISNFAQRRAWIFEAIYKTASAVLYI